MPSNLDASAQPLPRAFVGAAGAYAQIRAWGAAMGWSDRPFDYVLAQWLALRSGRTAGAGAAGLVRYAAPKAVRTAG